MSLKLVIETGWNDASILPPDLKNYGRLGKARIVGPDAQPLNLQHGLLLAGYAFSRRTFSPLPAIDLADAHRITSTGGKWAVDNLWGNFLLAWDGGNGDVHVLRSPSTGPALYHNVGSGRACLFTDLALARALGHPLILLDKGVRFQSWNHSVASKRKGGRVYVEVHATGEVEFHEGYITDREAAARARGEKAETQPKVQRPEVTSAMNTYIDLHRHAAVRAELARHGSVALRALAAHVIASADHFRIDLQSYVCPKDEVQESVETCASEVVFAERRRAVLAMLGLNPESLTVTGKSYGNARQFAPIFARLLELPDPAVLEVVAIVMGETLAAGSEAVEMIGQHLEVDPAKVWQADGAFWGLVRDKEVLGKIVAEVAGSEVAAANAGEKAKVLKAIVADHLEGSNGRAKVEAWVPKWLAFPPAPYTPRGGVGSVAANERMLHILARAAETQADAGDADPDDADNEDADIDDEKNVGEDGDPRGGADETLLEGAGAEDADDAPPLAA